MFERRLGVGRKFHRLCPPLGGARGELPQRMGGDSALLSSSRHPDRRLIIRSLNPAAAAAASCRSASDDHHPDCTRSLREEEGTRRFGRLGMGALAGASASGPWWEDGLALSGSLVLRWFIDRILLRFCSGALVLLLFLGYLELVRFFFRSIFIFVCLKLVTILRLLRFRGRPEASGVQLPAWSFWPGGWFDHSKLMNSFFEDGPGNDFDGDARRSVSRIKF